MIRWPGQGSDHQNGCLLLYSTYRTKENVFSTVPIESQCVSYLNSVRLATKERTFQNAK